ncbi:MAG: Rdx family protein [Planctomycetes bacterium]|nr:Rdx family protein [Planctomycetota bacterium]
MTEKIAKALKQKMSELTIAPFADGRFEVYVDGRKIWSKLETGEFPDEPTVVSHALSARRK